VSDMAGYAAAAAVAAMDVSVVRESIRTLRRTGDVLRTADGATHEEASTRWMSRTHDALLTAASFGVAGEWSEAFVPLLSESDFLRRCREKPCGYAGDYLTIEMMYRNEATSATPFGRGLDRWTFSQPCPSAVRNRRLLVQSFIDAAPSDAGWVRATSLGCGPASELLLLREPTRLDVTLVDLDQDALRMASERASLAGCTVKALHANILRMIFRDEPSLPSASQHLIYSLGLVDYFDDDLLVKLINYCYDKLVPGGQLVLGNFVKDHPNAEFFLHALDWPLHLRTPQEMVDLTRKTRFGLCPMEVGFESQGVQMFLKCFKL
jgi:extracellular factor (EF) 3-hydroxypalmitic acid methyl ester biosynthesis protein